MVSIPISMQWFWLSGAMEVLSRRSTVKTVLNTFNSQIHLTTVFVPINSCLWPSSFNTLTLWAQGQGSYCKKRGCREEWFKIEKNVSNVCSLMHIWRSSLICLYIQVPAHLAQNRWIFVVDNFLSKYKLCKVCCSVSITTLTLRYTY
jgi:hypothetical protein